MKTRLFVVVAGLLLLSACGGGGDGDTRVEGAWSRATPGTVTTGVVYMEITAPDGDTLTGVAVEPSVAAAAEMHETVVVDATMSMRPVTEVPIPAGETVAFAPGGLHVMLLDLTKPLAPGDSFPLSLTFAEAGQLVVDVEVLLDAPEGVPST